MEVSPAAIFPDALTRLREAGHLTRAILYDAVWHLPIEDIAPHLGISDRGLGKLCDRYEVPRPGRGDWQKMSAGKRVRRPKLPISEQWRAELVVLTQANVERRVQNREQDSEPDPLVAFWQSEVARLHGLRPAKPTPKSSTWATGWLARNHGGYTTTTPSLRPEQKLIAAAERRLASVVRGLLAEVERLGVSLGRESTGSSLQLRQGVSEVRCDLTIDVRQYRRPLTEEERRQRYRDPLSTWTQVKEVSGGVCLRLHCWLGKEIPQRWADTADQPAVENQMPEIVAAISAAFEHERRSAAQRQIQAERARLQEEERAQRRIIQEERKARRIRLLSAARAYRDAQDLRTLVAAARDRAQQAGLADVVPPWEAWAMKTAADLDPLGSSALLAALLGDYEPSDGEC